MTEGGDEGKKEGQSKRREGHERKEEEGGR